MLERWRERDVFHARSPSGGAPLWSFNEGPPTANGQPRYHVLSRVFKDIYPRYQAMTGHQVPHRAGWDCHGLPVELEVERERGSPQGGDRGLRDRRVQRAAASVFRYVEDWNRLTERIGFWIDLDGPT